VRLWSLHPKHLDAAGLVALWREGLLARAVLRGATQGYHHHPQLERFRRCPDPVAAIDGYLREVRLEALARGYVFDGRKLGPPRPLRRRPVQEGQLHREWGHLLRKLWLRSRAHWRRQRFNRPDVHPSFRVVPGGVEPWERAGAKVTPARADGRPARRTGARSRPARSGTSPGPRPTSRSRPRR
jgi:hypothetical protein